MSGIAGIVHFDGCLVEPGQIEAMTAAMAHRGPDGITHWQHGKVALGQCMLRTTPESLEEHLPLANEDGSLVLVMDGRVDNFEDLRRELLGRGAALRSRADAELVLRAYESWGEDCVHHIVGECVFFIWDARRQVLFAGRDAAGARHFYYHVGQGWFAFASEIKGLLALPQIERRLNESRVLDYLVPEFDRDDEVGTFWQGIVRLPAGHAMRAGAEGVKTWRWWQPGELNEQRFASMAECTEAFMDQLRVAVRCRLRSIKPVGAMLSGGLDSSSIVGLISKEFRDQLSEPLRTVSLAREDRENCHDWQSVRSILQADDWLQSTVVTPGMPAVPWGEVMNLATEDEPFGLSHGVPYLMAYRAGHFAGAQAMLDGMAGDLLFYSPDRSLEELVRTGKLGQLPSVMRAFRNHGIGGGWSLLARALLKRAFPPALISAARHKRDIQWLQHLTSCDHMVMTAQTKIAQKLTQHRFLVDSTASDSDQHRHARSFCGGVISFAHETYGQLALAQGVEPRSPYSDQRLLEFAIRLPIGAKLSMEWYKPLLRQSARSWLPEEVVSRRITGGNPGWAFYRRLADTAKTVALGAEAGRWLDLDKDRSTRDAFSSLSTPTEAQYLVRASGLELWLRKH